MTTKIEDDHDVTLRNDVVMKGPSDAPRPHADGCVGCRRAGICIRCAKPSLLGSGRCLSGACQECCTVIHRHIDNNPNAVVTYAAH